MANSAPIGASHNWTQTAWSYAVEHEVERQTVGMSFLGKDADSTFMLKEDLSKGRGEKIVVKFSPTDTVDGISEGEPVFANSQKLEFFDDEVAIDYLGFPFGLDSPMDQQRINSELKPIVFRKARVQWKRRWETVILNHMAGNTAANSEGAGGALKFVGHNTVQSIDVGGHKLFAQGSGSTNTTDVQVAADSAAVASLDHILEFEESAMSESFLTYPIGVGQDGYYDLIIHPMHWRQLRENSTAGEWEDIQLAQLKGGKKFEKTALAAGWMGLYSKTRIHVSDYIPQGLTNSTTNQANTRVMAFLGRCAGAMAFGGGYASGSHLDWSEAVHEHKKWSLLVDSIYGFTALFFNNEPYGVMGLTTFTPK